LRRAWDFQRCVPPDTQAVQALLPLVGWQQVERSGAQGCKVRLARSGMELDFGGFGKEYAADRAAAVLQRHGMTHALLNLGGDLHALGGRGLPQQQDASWQIAIQHPRPSPEQPQATLALLPLARGGLTTSGDYERFFIHEGRRYCHILDPRTGWPVSHWRSVSVLAANTTSAGALSTIAMLKADGALPWLQAQGVRYLAMDQSGRCWSDGLAMPPETSTRRVACTTSPSPFDVPRFSSTTRSYPCTSRILRLPFPVSRRRR